MSRAHAAAATAMATALLAATGSPAVGGSGVIERVLASHPEWFAAVLEHAEEHRLQILYTQIDRDADNRPTFRSHRHRLAKDRYFYPASTVKLPAAVLALEKLNDLAVPGLTRDSPFRVETATPGQAPFESDPGRAVGRPTIARDVEKVFVVSDNDAFNRLYEFVGQRALNERLWEMGFADARILRRLEAGLDPEENRVTSPLVFFGPDGREVYRQPRARNPDEWRVEMAEVRQGRGHYREGRLVDEPLDFSHSNSLSVETLQGILKAVMFPEAAAGDRRFRLGEDDYRLLYRAMSMLPRESVEGVSPEGEDHDDSYVKLFMFGDSKEPIPSGIRIFNKVGQAYGYLIDNALIVDFDNGVEFFLTAVIQVNANQVYGDDVYEYDEVGIPFLARLGRVIHDYELGRERAHRPDLSRLAAYR